MAHSHGTNDAQKTMGIIALALFTGTSNGTFAHLPRALHFLHTPVFKVPTWVVVACAATMAAGTAAGGWRIIRTFGHKMVKLQPVHGFAAETTAAVIIQVASSYGIPLSTTHVISTSIMGVGAVKRFSGVKWSVVATDHLGLGVYSAGDGADQLPAGAPLGFAMKLYFLRHGQADWPNWEGPDDDRPLTEAGREEVQAVAQLLVRLKAAPDLILTSPLPRAAQTAYDRVGKSRDRMPRGEAAQAGLRSG